MWQRTSSCREGPPRTFVRLWHWFHPGRALVFVATTTVIMFVVEITSGSRWDPGPIPFDDAVRRIPAYFGILTGLYYLFQLVTFRLRKTVVCRECGKIRAFDGCLDCECGGRFTPLRGWKWAKDGSSKGGSEERETMICNRCSKLKVESPNLQCPCGGRFTPLAHWEWSDEFFKIGGLRPRELICAECHTLKTADGNVDCACGGHLGPLDYWEWVEDKGSDSEGDQGEQ